jgi:hypothetical protein
MRSQSFYLEKLNNSYGSHATKTHTTNLYVPVYAVALVKSSGVRLTLSILYNHWCYWFYRVYWYIISLRSVPSLSLLG